VETAVFPREDYPDRASRDAAIGDWVEGRGTDLIALAGYMQLLSPAFVARYRHRIVNVHPALLPSFPGLTLDERRAVDVNEAVFRALPTPHLDRESRLGESLEDGQIGAGSVHRQEVVEGEHQFAVRMAERSPAVGADQGLVGRKGHG
jgi:hypothetical protein